MYFASTKGGKKTGFVSSMLFCIEDGGDEEASFVFVRSFCHVISCGPSIAMDLL